MERQLFLTMSLEASQPTWIFSIPDVDWSLEVENIRLFLKCWVTDVLALFWSKLDIQCVLPMIAAHGKFSLVSSVLRPRMTRQDKASGRELHNNCLCCVYVFIYLFGSWTPNNSLNFCQTLSSAQAKVQIECTSSNSQRFSYFRTSRPKAD